MPDDAMESNEWPAAKRARLELAPADALDPVLERYKKDIDFTLVERNLRLTTEQRARQLVQAVAFIRKFRPLVDLEAIAELQGILERQRRKQK
jgi:hypothetical protein